MSTPRDRTGQAWQTIVEFCACTNRIYRRVLRYPQTPQAPRNGYAKCTECAAKQHHNERLELLRLEGLPGRMQ